jgi:hypothetical protein
MNRARFLNLIPADILCKTSAIAPANTSGRNLTVTGADREMNGTVALSQFPEFMALEGKANRYRGYEKQDAGNTCDTSRSTHHFCVCTGNYESGAQWLTADHGFRSRFSRIDIDDPGSRVLSRLQSWSGGVD